MIIEAITNSSHDTHIIGSLRIWHWIYPKSNKLISFELNNPPNRIAIQHTMLLVLVTKVAEFTIAPTSETKVNKKYTRCLAVMILFPKKKPPQGTGASTTERKKEMLTCKISGCSAKYRYPKSLSKHEQMKHTEGQQTRQTSRMT